MNYDVIYENEKGEIMKHSQDHFSPLAKAYAKGRISYPKELFRFLAGLSASKALAWDCATGSGQVARDLAGHFDRVIATDISASLISQATAPGNVIFKIAESERSGLEDESVDLITVAQAIHWFDLQAFWTEVDRVLKSGGILAYWGYVWPAVNEQVDKLLETFRETIVTHWPEKSRLLNEYYEQVQAPFAKQKSPRFEIVEDWTPIQYLNHLSSWSGTRYFNQASKRDLVSEMSRDFHAAWGETSRKVRWSLILKTYQKP